MKKPKKKTKEVVDLETDILMLTNRNRALENENSMLLDKVELRRKERDDLEKLLEEKATYIDELEGTVDNLKFNLDQYREILRNLLESIDYLASMKGIK